MASSGKISTLQIKQMNNQLSTRLLHADECHEDQAVSPAISVTTTWSAQGEGADGRYVYGRIGTPVRDRAEVLLGELEGGHAVLYSSGLAALWAALVYYNPKRVAVDGGYHGTLFALDMYSRKYGTRLIGLEEDFKAGDMVWLETPKNPKCEVYDVAFFATKCQVTGATLCVDSTFAPPPLQKLLTCGAHCIMHSSTKYLAGHSDALGGVLVVPKPKVAEDLRSERTLLGSVPGSLEAWLLVRSLRTLPLRVNQQNASALCIVQWLSSGAASHVVKVHHPSLSTSPGHAIAMRQMAGGYGPMFSFECDSEVLARTLPQRTRLFLDATSLGGVESLMEWRYKHDKTQPLGLLRVSIGLEDAEDLIKDLEQALDAPLDVTSAPRCAAECEVSSNQ